jgi:diguanylate cyclase (GGDEF)-like protein/PAS domain S-box-containing protein
MSGEYCVKAATGDDFFDAPNQYARYKAVFDGYPGQVAILDASGRIAEVNAGWERFARENGFSGECRFTGTDYFAACQGTAGADAEDAVRAAEGIRDVLAGRAPRFSLEYPCHSLTQKRWFLLVATPLEHQGVIKGAIVAHLPITERKLAELALAQSEKRLNQAQRLARVGSFERDLETGVGYWSDELFRMAGLPPGPHSPRFNAFLAVVHPEDRARVAAVVGRVRQQEQPEEFAFRTVSPDGGVRHLAASIALERDERGRPVSYHGAMVDVTRLKEVEASLVRLAATDELTGIHNRRRFLELLRGEMERCGRYGHHVSLAMLDIDNFKRINDTHGHAVGDEVLRRLSATIAQALRASDVFGRIGGEEFAVILTETSPDMALAACRRLVRTVADAGAVTSAGALPLTISVGLATAYSDKARPEGAAAGRLGCACGMDADMLLRLADQALYRAKAEGKNRVCRFEQRADPAPETAHAPSEAASAALRDAPGGDDACGLDKEDEKRT